MPLLNKWFYCYFNVQSVFIEMIEWWNGGLSLPFFQRLKEVRMDGFTFYHFSIKFMVATNKYSFTK